MRFICHGKLTWQYVPCKALCKGQSEVSLTILETFRSITWLQWWGSTLEKDVCFIYLSGIMLFDQALEQKTKKWGRWIAIHFQMMALFVFFKVLISCCQDAKQAGSIVVYAGYFFSTLQVFVGIADWLCFNQTVDNLSKFIRSHMCIMSSLALMSLCPGRDLLIGHGRCTSCVQRHLAAVAVRREGIDLGSLLCMRKTIPDLGLVVWAAW